MANQIEGVTDKLLACATEEFLHKGYKDASLRDIARCAATSTSSVYVRFKDKAGLFSAIVHPVAEGFKQLLLTEIDRFETVNGAMPVEEMLHYTDEQLDIIVDGIYDNYDAFKLLLCCSDGTEFNDFIGRLADIEASHTLKYIDAIGNDAVSSGRLSMELLHMLSSAYWTGVFEAVRHDMNRQDAKAYISRIKRFFHCGWRDIFSPVEE